MLRYAGTALLALAASALLAGVALAGAPHQSWPARSGELWINHANGNALHHGTKRNDELLGGHANDVIYGHRGADVIWGDQGATGNTVHQTDLVFGGGGNDWIYASHGRNTVYAGGGDDKVRVWFGRGFVDCGAGRDILYVSHKQGPHVKRRHCETISHLSARQAEG
jgi:Ca2+-binding RTX toxin-like protein